MRHAVLSIAPRGTLPHTRSRARPTRSRACTWAGARVQKTVGWSSSHDDPVWRVGRGAESGASPNRVTSAESTGEQIFLQGEASWVAISVVPTSGRTLRREEPHQKRCPLTDLSMQGVCDLINEGLVSNIVWMSGAGTAAQAFQTFAPPGRGSGWARRYNLPTFSLCSTLVFSTSPFGVMISRNLYPGRHCPTKTHFFLKLLQQGPFAQRTLRILTAERMAGIPSPHIVEAHGTWQMLTA